MNKFKFDIQRHREATDVEYRGNRRWSGNWGRVYINSSLIFEIKSFECKVNIDREDVYIGISKDSKVTGLAGEGSITILKVFNRGFSEYLNQQKQGHDPRFSITANISDPDMLKSGVETISIENVQIDSIDLLSFEKGAVVEAEIPFRFTPEDARYLSTVEL